jgi:DNA repair protein RAD57
MTNPLLVLPEFDVRPYSHILPSLEKALVSTADLLTLDALDVAKRAQVPPGEVKKLADALLEGLHSELAGSSALQRHGATNVGSEVRLVISTLDDHIDHGLGGGIWPGHLTEVVGERQV